MVLLVFTILISGHFCHLRMWHGNAFGCICLCVCPVGLVREVVCDHWSVYYCTARSNMQCVLLLHSVCTIPSAMNYAHYSLLHSNGSSTMTYGSTGPTPTTQIFCLNSTISMTQLYRDWELCGPKLPVAMPLIINCCFCLQTKHYKLTK